MQNISLGTAVTVKIKGQLVQGVYDGRNEKYGLPYVKLTNGSRVLRKIFAVNGVAVSESPSQPELTHEALPSVPGRVFDINTRFTFVESFVKMIARGPSTSLIIAGSGGLGKSYTVKKVLASCGMIEDEHFIIVKGYATPKSLYRKLYENPSMIIIFDDCDSVLKDQTAVNLLKAALDSEAVRTISWLSEQRGEDSLPTSFEFSGKVIFLTNMDRTQVPQAMLSRAQLVDVSMTADEKIERMRSIAVDIRSDLEIELKHEVINFLNEFRHRCKDLNLRTLLKVMDIRTSEPQLWRDIAEYSISL
jgi:hypothetical protein